jgi:hypothetical protein
MARRQTRPRPHARLRIRLAPRAHRRLPSPHRARHRQARRIHRHAHQRPPTRARQRLRHPIRRLVVVVTRVNQPQRYPLAGVSCTIHSHRLQIARLWFLFAVCACHAVDRQRRRLCVVLDPHGYREDAQNTTPPAISTDDERRKRTCGVFDDRGGLRLGHAVAHGQHRDAGERHRVHAHIRNQRLVLRCRQPHAPKGVSGQCQFHQRGVIE